ncbi:MAG: hypothetical protein HQ519_19550 [Planctomycetes bacterium]|nr:hypothetical protein [Planctomycetota bacterium]
MISSVLLLSSLPLLVLLPQDPAPANPQSPVAPSRREVIEPLHKTSFNDDGQAKERRQGGNPRQVSGYLAFDGSMDGNRQVDPQIAVGGGYVFHGTNSGLVIYDKKGQFVQGVSQRAFNNGIDPKLFFDAHNKVFGFDLWNPWDEAKLKPVNISVSESDDPTGAWNTYPVPAPGGVDGGGIGYSKKWIGYSFPGGEDRTFVLPMKAASQGKPATVYHFAGSLGHPVAVQDNIDDLYFFQLTNKEFVIRRVSTAKNGEPQAELVARKAHGLENVGWPPQSPQKGTDQKTSSGDRNPKNLVLQGKHIWFSHTVQCDGRAAVQWHQVALDASIVQSGLLSSPTSSYIQTTLAVNKKLDVLIGFQETSPKMYISPRMAFRRGSDPAGQMGDIISLGEGQGFTDGTSWGDYSGSVVDGDNGIDLWTIQSITGTDGKGDTVITKVPCPSK